MLFPLAKVERAKRTKSFISRQLSLDVYDPGWAVASVHMIQTMQMFAYIAGFRASTGNAHLCCTGSENPILFISEHLLSRCQMQRSSGQEMKLISFSFFLLLLQTFRGIDGDVRCGDNHTVPSCRLCLFASPPAPLGIDRQNCNTSPDCMLNDDSSMCVMRPTTTTSTTTRPGRTSPAALLYHID